MPQPQKCEKSDLGGDAFVPNGIKCGLDLPCPNHTPQNEKSHQPKPEVWECQSVYDGNKGEVVDCTCGKCADAIKPSPASTEDWEKTITPELRTELVRLAYKYIPLPSGCSNCWGDLHQGCTDECINSSRQQHEKVMDFVRTIYLLLSSHDQQLRQRIVEIIKNKREMYEPAYEEADKAIVETLSELEAFITNLK